MSWFAVTCVGLGNLYLGRLVGLIGIPPSIRGRRSIPAAILFCSFWIGGLWWLYRINGLELTFLQACMLAALVYIASSVTRHELGLNPKVPWSTVLNRRLDAVMRICARHNWAVATPESIRLLAEPPVIHFDGGDYDLLQQMFTDDEYEFNQTRSPLVPRTADGSIEYDRACAQEIVMLANMLHGDEEIPGIIKHLSQLHDLSDLKWPAYKTLLELAGAIRRQWGTESLWSRKNSPGSTTRRIQR